MDPGRARVKDSSTELGRGKVKEKLCLIRLS